MSKSIQDQFIDDDEDETCPLCVEEFDLTDKGFRPCECGYQICQFCYHNVKTNMNGLCPACRRPYDDNKIQYKVITPEETAAHKARQAQKAKKSQAAAQKEKAKAEADNMSRKHLAGLRVVQKNLVYVTGLNPTTQEDQLLQTLRGDQYFGQYGKIIKIVVSKAKDPSNPHSVGVYVTYERKEDAASCIALVDGSKNGERTLRAQFGTTKYCSSYLRGETCLNRNCMFLHEPGEANESYSRAELSAHNAGSSQHGRSAPPQPQQPLASAAPPMARSGSTEPSNSPPSDRPALPSTASWASKTVLPARTESRAASVSVGSPAVTNAVLDPTPSESRPTPTPAPQTQPTAQPAPVETKPASAPAHAPPRSGTNASRLSPFLSLVKGLKLEDFQLVWSPSCLSEADLGIVNSYPPLFDQNGGPRRRARRQREEEQRRMEQEAQAFQQPPAVEADEDPEMSGSLQLGGEPEERQNIHQTPTAIHPPGQEGGLNQRFQFGGDNLNPSAGSHGLTQQQLLLQTLKPSPSPNFTNNAGQAANAQSTLTQQNGAPGHQRNVSRYSFANDTASASTAVKPVANAKLMNQQSSMMPTTGSSHFGAQQPHGQFYTSNVQGPPPGLKPTGTPPVSGNLTFGQGHGFATGGLQYVAGTARNQQDNYYRDLMRGGRDAAAGGGMDAKLDAEFPALGLRTRQQSIAASLDESRRSTPPVPPGFEVQLANESRRATPSIPPGLSRPTALPDLEGGPGSTTSRPSSRASLRRGVSAQITPAVPLCPATPSGTAATPPRNGITDDDHGSIIHETPTKSSKAVGDIVSKKEGPFVNMSPAPATALDNAALASKDEEFSKPKPSTKKEAANATTVPLKSSKSTRASNRSPSKTTSAKETSETSIPPVTPVKGAPKPSDKKSLGKLDITAAVMQQEPSKQAASPSTQSATPAGSQRSMAVPTPSMSTKASDSPGPVTESPAKKPAPRVLRVVQTPKEEIMPPVPTIAPTLPSMLANRHALRKASVTSINFPGTPSSELVSMSDNMSIASTNAHSRAGSPPPFTSKVGSAPIRTKTKSQQKKDRQERAKMIEQEMAKNDDETKSQPEIPAQEAILSRKKKAKREKEPKLKPVASTTETKHPIAPKAAPKAQNEQKHNSTSESTVQEPIKKEVKPAPPVKSSQVLPPAPPTLPTHREPSPPPTPTNLSAAQIIADLKAHTPEIQKCIEQLFKVTNHNAFKYPPNFSSQRELAAAMNWRADFKLNLTKSEVDDLLRGRYPAVNYSEPHSENNPWERGMVTASGAHLRALTKELESRFVELEQALREIPEEFRFRPGKPQNETKFPHMDLVALQREYENLSHGGHHGGGGRGPNVMEQMVQDGANMRKGAFLVDEASRYINEFVMPPVTPPPSVGGNGNGNNGGGGNGKGGKHGSGGQQGGAGNGSQHADLVVPSLDVAERQLNEAKRHAEEREVALKKQMKKNKKLIGISA